MDPTLGIFVVPDATNAASTVAQILEAERSGLDMAGVQDHPYQWRFFDTWTLLAYVARRTERVRLVPDVLSEELGFSTLLVGVPHDDPVTFVRGLGEDVGPRLRELLG